MDIASLQAFLAVADTGSFSAAAEQVYLTQPAVSKRIRALESELGARVFDRIGRRTQLTETGRALLPRARSIVNEVKDTRQSLRDLAGKISGELIFATSHHIGLHRLPSALKAYHAAHPAVSLNIRFMDSERACAAVAAGDLELALVTLPPQPVPELSVTPVWLDPLDVVVAPNHPLARAKGLTARGLTAYSAILPGPGTYTREIILRAFGRLRARVQIGMATNYLEVLKMLTDIGLGWSALPRTMIDAELKVVQIKNMEIRRSLGVVTSARRTLSNAGRALIDVVKSQS